MFHGEQDTILHAVEIPLKNATTGFSTPVEFHQGWYRETGIEECRIVDFPTGETQEVHEDYEKLTLFD